MSEEVTTYSATRTEVLTSLEAVRKRPGMYIGSTGERGLHHMVFEVTDEAVNEVLAGRASRVDVTLTPDGGVRVADDGPGFPHIEDLLTRMQTGWGPGGRHSVTAGFSFGVGLFVVNALSSRLTAEVGRKDGRWARAYERGVADTPPTGAEAAGGIGTTITFRPDPDVFGSARFSFDDLAARFTELAFLNRGLEMTLTDRRHPGEPRSARFHAPGGISELLAALDGEAAADTLAFEREDPRMEGTMDLAFRWRHSSDGTRIRSFANSRPTAGGTHESGFRAGAAASLTAWARARHLLPPGAAGLTPDRIAEGLTAVVSVKLDHPEFEGSVRDLLGTTAARTCVEEAVREHLCRWLEEHPDRAEALLTRFL